MRSPLVMGTRLVMRTRVASGSRSAASAEATETWPERRLAGSLVAPVTRKPVWWELLSGALVQAEPWAQPGVPRLAPAGPALTAPVGAPTEGSVPAWPSAAQALAARVRREAVGLAPAELAWR